MTRRYAWADVGARAIADAPNGHWKTTTFLAGLTCEGLIAPFVLDGPINAECFLAYVEQILVPVLRQGDTVILDNLSSHKNEEAARLIAGAGARLLFLPPYSPDLNPIEMAFAKLKELLRQAQARTVDALWDLIGRTLNLFTPEECANYVAPSLNSRKCHMVRRVTLWQAFCSPIRLARSKEKAGAPGISW